MLFKIYVAFVKESMYRLACIFLTWTKEGKWIKTTIISSLCHSRLKKVILTFLMGYLYLELSELSLNVLFSVIQSMEMTKFKI